MGNLERPKNGNLPPPRESADGKVIDLGKRVIADAKKRQEEMVHDALELGYGLMRGEERAEDEED